MGHPNRGDGLADQPEGMAMRWKPFAILIEVKRTRTAWQLTFRVQFAS